jgi:formate hydrogenlyase subunit 6/NADH:ubiquinone oxidoreductase subunit I
MIYSIDLQKCKKCNLCVKKCTVTAIDNGQWTIDNSLCIKCGLCAEVCKFGAVSVT